MVKISGPGRMGSTKAIKKSLESKARLTKTIPSEDSITVRFLEEPEDFYGYYQHWFTDGPRPCVEGDCEGCNDDNPDVRKKTFRYLANGYVIDEQKVCALELPKSLVEQLVGYFEKKGTLLDRDYELSRSGSGINNTKYLAAPDSPTKMTVSRFKKLDLGKVLSSMVINDEDDDEDEDDEPVTTRRSSKRSSKRPSRQVEEDPWDDEDEDDEDEDDDERPARRRVTKKPVAKRSSVSARRTTSNTNRKIRRN